jgi:hypothetical protein
MANPPENDAFHRSGDLNIPLHAYSVWIYKENERFARNGVFLIQKTNDCQDFYISEGIKN